MNTSDNQQTTHCDSITSKLSVGKLSSQWPYNVRILFVSYFCRSNTLLTKNMPNIQFCHKTLPPISS